MKNYCKALLVSIYLVVMVFKNYELHPYQEIYFNHFVGENISDKFEIDYWGLSSMEGYGRILELKKEGEIKIFTNDETGSTVTLNMFLPDEKKRISFTNILEEADYCLIIHRQNFSISRNGSDLSGCYKTIRIE